MTTETNVISIAYSLNKPCILKTTHHLLFHRTTYVQNSNVFENTMKPHILFPDTLLCDLEVTTFFFQFLLPKKILVF